MRPIYLTRALTTAGDANGIAESQALAAAGYLTLNGVFVEVQADPDGLAASQTFAADVPLTLAANIPSAGPARPVSITSSDDASISSFLVRGYAPNGLLIQETIVGPNNDTVIGNLLFASVLSVTPTVSGTTEEVEVGWSFYGAAALGPQRKVILTASDDISTVGFTITGRDDQGHVISEVVTGVDTTPVQSVLDYAYVDSIYVDDDTATETVEAGTNDVGACAPIPMDQYPTDFTAMVSMIVRSGSVDFTAQYTFDDIFAAYAPADALSPGSPAGDPTSITWVNSSVTGASADARFQLDAPVRAVRVLTNSGTGELGIEVVQGGLA